MGIMDDKFVPTIGAVVHYDTNLLTPNISMTAAPIIFRQMRSGFRVLGVSVRCRTVAGVISYDVGTVAVGSTYEAVSMGIAATTTKFKITAAFTGLVPTADTNTGLLATLVAKAIADNIAFSSAYTINTAAAAGQFWGTFLVQMNSAGTVSTKAVSANQVFQTKADAQNGALGVIPDAGQMKLGTISIQSGSGVAFICGTTALTGGGVTVSYDGVAAGYVSVLTGAITPVAATLVQGTVVTNATTRTVSQPGGLLVARYTSDGSGALTDASINIESRPFPLNGEMRVNPLGA